MDWYTLLHVEPPTALVLAPQLPVIFPQLRALIYTQACQLPILRVEPLVFSAVPLSPIYICKLDVWYALCLEN